MKTKSQSHDLSAAAQKWADDLKLDESVQNLIPKLNLERMYDIWQLHQRGVKPPGIGLRPLPHGMHGVTRIRRGQVQSMDVNNQDPPDRQSLALVHEMMHAYAHPRQPDHHGLHVLAAGLVNRVFPDRAKALGDMTYFDADEMAALADIAAMDAEEFGDMEVPLTDMEVPLTDDDYDLHFWKKLQKIGGKVLDPFGLTGSKGIIGRNRKAIQNVLLPGSSQLQKLFRGGVAAKRKDGGIAAAAAQQQYSGWIMPFITQAFETQSLIVPRKGIARATPLHNISGFTGTTFGAFWQTLIQSLESGDGRAQKARVAATVVAGVPTVLTIPAGPPTARSCGLIVRISNSILAATNEDVEVQVFTQAGATQQIYILDLEYIKGVSEFIVMYVENDRGRGLPTSRNDMQLTLPADAISAGTRVAIQTINYRDLGRP